MIQVLSQHCPTPELFLISYLSVFLPVCLTAGGFKGCGHGHKGHPGKPHWSCCGNTAEQSECLPQSVLAAVSPRGHLRTVELWGDAEYTRDLSRWCKLIEDGGNRKVRAAGGAHFKIVGVNLKKVRRGKWSSEDTATEAGHQKSPCPQSDHLCQTAV